MKEPCKDCPFKKSVHYTLSEEKAKDILDGLRHDAAFHCHQTVDYSKHSNGRVTRDSKLCFGAVLFMENTLSGGCRANLAFRLGFRSKELQVSDLRKSENIYQSFEEFLDGVSII